MSNKQIYDELAYAKAKHGDKFNSNHEFYAVLLEELEETQHEIDLIERKIKGELWKNIKADNSDAALFISGEILEVVKRGITELSQIGAVLIKHMEDNYD